MSDIRDDLEAAAKELTSDEGEAGAENGVGQGLASGVGDQVGGVTPAPDGGANATGDATPVERTGEARARDEKGRFVPKAEAKEAAPAPAGAAQPVVPSVTPPAAAPTPPAPVAEAKRPPQSWKPSAREKWNALPPEIQDEILRREGEVPKALNDTAEARKFHQAFQERVRQFEPMYRARGIDPMQAFESYARTDAILSHGSPEQKAQVFAQLMRQYGVAEQQLAAVLDGAAPQGQPQSVDPQSIAMQVRQQLMADLQRQKQLVTQQQAVSEVQAFEANAPEFFEDVRTEMAALMGGYAQQGRELSLKQAYDLACQLNPDVSAVLKQREAAKSTVTAQAATQKAKAAASSVKASPAPGIQPGQPDSLREALMQSWNDLSGR